MKLLSGMLAVVSSQASVVRVAGETRFLKFDAPKNDWIRYSNFESEILAHNIFETVGVRSPEAEVTQLQKGTPPL